MTTVLVVTGPAPGRLLSRPLEAATVSLGDLADDLVSLIPGVTVDFRQTDDEAQLIAWLREAVDHRWGVVLDPAAFTHYSYALRDAATLVTGAGLPLIEVHLTKPATRDDAIQAGVISAVSTGVISGLGLDSYRFAVQAAASRLVALPA